MKNNGSQENLQDYTARLIKAYEEKLLNEIVSNNLAINKVTTRYETLKANLNDDKDVVVKKINYKKEEYVLWAILQKKEKKNLDSKLRMKY